MAVAVVSNMHFVASLSLCDLAGALHDLRGLRLEFEGPSGEPRSLVLESGFGVRFDRVESQVVISCGGRLCLMVDGAPVEATVKHLEVTLASQVATTDEHPRFAFRLASLELYQGRGDLELVVSKLVRTTILPGELSLWCDLRDVAHLMLPGGLSGRGRNHQIRAGELRVGEQTLDVRFRLERKADERFESGEFRISDGRRFTGDTATDDVGAA